MFSLSAFISYVVVSCITPGPNNIMSMSNAAKYGYRRSVKFCFGVATGFLLILLCSILCNMFLYHYIPRIEQIMTVFGSIYILWLAWAVYRDKPKAEKKRKIDLDTTAFSTAIVLQFVNPKGLLYGLTVISNFVFPYYQSVGVLAAVLAFNWVVVALSCNCWALFGSVFRNFFDRYRKILNAVMALLLVYCALSLYF